MVSTSLKIDKVKKIRSWIKHKKVARLKYKSISLKKGKEKGIW